MEFIWSRKASSSLDEIRFHIRDNFSAKEELTFIEQVVQTLEAIGSFPKGFPECKVPKQARKAVIHPHSTLFYRIKSKKRVELLLFWDNRNNPKKIK